MRNYASSTSKSSGRPWLAPQSRAMNAYRDALCLIHLESRYKDQGLLLEGRTRHLAAFACMQEEVEKDGAATDDCTLGAAYTLGHCELYKVISQNGVGWPGHVGGMQELLEIRGPKSIRSPFAYALLHNIRQVSMMKGFLLRKGSFLARPEWIACAAENASPAVKATNLALIVGAVLEKADKLAMCSRNDLTEQNIVRHLDDMVGLQSELQR